MAPVCVSICWRAPSRVSMLRPKQKKRVQKASSKINLPHGDQCPVFDWVLHWEPPKVCTVSRNMVKLPNFFTICTVQFCWRWRRLSDVLAMFFSVFPYRDKRYFSCSPLSIALWNGANICKYKAYWHMNLLLINGCGTRKIIFMVILSSEVTLVSSLNITIVTKKSKQTSVRKNL